MRPSAIPRMFFKCDIDMQLCLAPGIPTTEAGPATAKAGSAPQAIVVF
jgi:hypothetical protein